MRRFKENWHLSKRKRRKSEEANRKEERIITDDEFRFVLFSDIAYAAERKIGDHNTPEERLIRAKTIHSQKYPHLGIQDYEIVECNKSMYGAINKNNKKAVIAVRGSNFRNLKDLYNVLNLASNGVLPHNKQKRVDRFIEEFMRKYPDYDITLTGHSAGGYHCEYNAMKTGLKCESFNSGTPLFPDNFATHPHIKSHVITLDVIALRAVPGQRIEWEREKKVGRHHMASFIKKYDRQRREKFGIVFGDKKDQEEPETIKDRVDDKQKQYVKDAVEEVGNKIEEGLSFDGALKS